MRRRRQRGAAAIDYLGVVLVVGLVMAGLVAVRPYQPSRRPPIDPVSVLARPLKPPPRLRTRPRAVRSRPRPPRRRPARPRPPGITVEVPRWWLGR